MVLGAGSGGERWWDDFSPLRGSRGRTLAITRGRLLVSEAARLRHGRDTTLSPASPSLSILSLRDSADFARRSVWLGTVPPAPVTDPPFSARSIRCRTPLHRLRGMRSLIPSVANCRDSQEPSGASRRFRKPEAAMLRISARTRHYGREAAPGQAVGISPRCYARAGHRHYGARLRLSPRKAAIARVTSSGQDSGINREIGHFRTAFISQATLRRTETADLTVKTNFA
jgi:hypothetical protein